MPFFSLAVSHLCEGSCKAVEFIGRGLCNVLDVAVEFLKLTEMATAWVGQAINFVLTALFRIHRYGVVYLHRVNYGMATHIGFC